MKGKDLHNEMGKIDDKLVQEAENTKRLNKRPAALRWGALAACAALVVCGVFGVFGGKGAGIDPVAAAQYPQSYAYDDYEGRDKVRKENPVDETFYEAMDQFAYRTFAQFL